MKTLKMICTIVLVIMLLFGVAAGIGRIVTGGWDFGGLIKGGEITQPESPDTSGNVPTTPNNSTTSGNAVVENIEGNGIQILSAKLPRAAYAVSGVSAQADTAYNLTASITPASATDKNCDWTVAWKNANSEWATGKTVTDYVTVTATSDGALTAVVECKQAFGEQVIVSVVSRDNTQKNAKCTVDYLKRITSATSSISVSSANEIAIGKATNFSLNVNYSVGTVSSSNTYTYNLKFTDEFRNAVMSNSTFQTACMVSGDVNKRSYIKTSIPLTVNGGKFTLGNGENLFFAYATNSSAKDAFYTYANNAFYQTISSFSGTFGVIEVEIVSTYGSISETKTVSVNVNKIDVSAVKTAVTGVTLDETAIVF